jgi:tyrosine-protein kinase Etk/Wzc
MENSTNVKKVNIFYILQIFLNYWPILFLSTLIFVGIGMFFLRHASKTFSVYGRILINTEREAGTGGGSNAYINVNDLMNQQKSFTNEVSYLNSTPLIKEVINDMNLFTSYYMQDDRIPKEFTFSLINIYKKTPFIVIVDEDNLQPLNTLFYVQIIDENQFVLNAYEEKAHSYNCKNEIASKEEIKVSVDGTFKFGQMIKSKNFSFKILLNANYDEDYYKDKDLFFRFNSPQELAYEFQKSLSVGSAFYESSIADLTFEWENLDMSVEFLTLLIDKYIQKNLEKKNFNANKTIDYIEDQLSKVSGTLGQSENRLQSFKSTQDVMNIDQKTSDIFGKLQSMEQERNILQTRYNDLVNLKGYFEENENASTFIAPSSIGMSDATLATLIQELTTLSTEKQNLISTNQLKNPRIKTLDANMATIRKVITDNINFSISSAQNELNELNNRILKANSEYARLPQTQRQLAELERDFNLNDVVYSSLLNQRIQAKIMKASNRPDCEIIEPVHYLEVTAPSPKKIGIVFLFLGLFFPSVYIVIVNFLSPKIRTKDELFNFCHLQSIGDVPHNEKTALNVISNYPQSPIVEKFHSIRSNLIYYMYGETHKCILLTSTLPNEGKSFTSLNLALSFASTNSKTLLINFDLRKNSNILNELKVNALVGLNMYLIGRASLDDIILETPYPNLHYIHNGQIPHDPVVLLSSPRIKEMFEILRAEYDYIIIDTPPFGMVTDAFLLMQYSNINLYVSRLGVVTKKAIKQCMEELQMKKISNLYLVRNDIAKLDKSYSDKYAYGEAKKSFLSKLLKPSKMKKKSKR